MAVSQSQNLKLLSADPETKCLVSPENHKRHVKDFITYITSNMQVHKKALIFLISSVALIQHEHKPHKTRMKLLEQNHLKKKTTKIAGTTKTTSQQVTCSMFYFSLLAVRSSLVCLLLFVSNGSTTYTVHVYVDMVPVDLVVAFQ